MVRSLQREEVVDAMTKYLISFPSAAMVVPDEDLQAVSDAAHAVVQEAKDAGVWVFGGGIDESIPPVMVDGDGTVTEGTYTQTKLTALERLRRPAGMQVGHGDVGSDAAASAASRRSNGSEAPCGFGGASR